jgi:hypothetical protein
VSELSDGCGCITHKLVGTYAEDQIYISLGEYLVDETRKWLATRDGYAPRMVNKLCVYCLRNLVAVLLLRSVQQEEVTT